MFPKWLFVFHEMHRWKQAIDDIKLKYRPALNSWNSGKFACVRNNEFDELKKSPKATKHVVASVDGMSLTADKFRELYEFTSTPCIIQSIPKFDKWPATNIWEFETLLARYRNCHFCCGRDPEGNDFLVKLDDYFSYMKANDDDSPLYLFDTYFELDELSAELLSHYSVPSYFPEDLLNLLDPDERPSYRWFLIGPKRSGTVLHIDPLHTAAWNTLLKGRKRWVLFPPSFKKSQLLPSSSHDIHEQEAIHYFLDQLPVIKQAHPDYPVYEVMQEAGDTLFVPSGWWHAVINVEDTVAITQVISYKMFILV